MNVIQDYILKCNKKSPDTMATNLLTGFTKERTFANTVNDLPIQNLKANQLQQLRSIVVIVKTKVIVKSNKVNKEIHTKKIRGTKSSRSSSMEKRRMLSPIIYIGKK